MMQPWSQALNKDPGKIHFIIPKFWGKIAFIVRHNRIATRSNRKGPGNEIVHDVGTESDHNDDVDHANADDCSGENDGCGKDHKMEMVVYDCDSIVLNLVVKVIILALVVRVTMIVTVMMVIKILPSLPKIL